MAYNQGADEYGYGEQDPNETGAYDDEATNRIINRTGATPAQNNGGPRITTEPVDNTKPKVVSPGINYDRGAFRDAWMSSNQTMQEFQAAHPEWGLQITGDKFTTPNGEVLDAVIGSKAGGTAHGWTAVKGEGGIPVGTPGYDWGGGSGSAGSGAPGSASYPGGPGGGYDDMVYKAISDLISSGSKPVTEDDVMSQYAPVSRTYQRGAEHARQQAAERLAFEGRNVGGDSAALDAEGNKINEGLAESQGKLMAGLIGDELKARREKIYNAVQFAQGAQKIQLQSQLQAIDAELRRMGLGLQAQQLAQQNSQFYDRLGFDIGDREQYWNYAYNNSAAGGGS